MEQIIEQLMYDGAIDSATEIHLIEEFKVADIDMQVETLEALMDLGYIQLASQLVQNIDASESSEMNYTLAELAFLQGDMDGAILYTSSVEKNSDVYVKALILEAEIYANLDLPDVSEKKLKEMRHYVDDAPLADLFLAEFYYSQENYEQAYHLYAKLVDEPDYEDKVDNAKFASLSYALGEYETALTFFQKVIHPETLSELQVVEYSDLLLQSEKEEEAISILTHYVDENPYHIPNVRIRLGQLWIYKDNLEKAKACIQQGLVYDDENSQLLLFDALIAKRENNMYRFEQQLHKVLVNHPENIGALRELIDYKFSQEAYEEIAQLIAQFESLGEYDVVYEWYKAKLLNVKGHDSDAFTAYQEIFDDMQTNSQYLNEFAILANELSKNDVLRMIVVSAIEHETELEHIELYKEVLSID